MQELTLLVAVVSGVAVLFMTPLRGLIIFVACFAWYPMYLSVQVGTVDFTVPRIVILILLLKLLLLTDLPRRFRFTWLDRTIIIYFIAQIAAGAMTTTSLNALIENRAGAAFDMVLPYFVVRLIIKDRRQYTALLKAIVVIAAPLAIMGFYECLTGRFLLGFMRGHMSWMGPFGALSETPGMRFGFYRAEVSFSHAIMYGLFFGMFGPPCVGILRNMRRHKKLYWMGLGLMGVGVFSSMSSGPVLAALLAIPFIGFYNWRRHWKPVVITIVVMCGIVEIISNVHFYNVLGRFAMSTQTAWYRGRLIEVALFEGGMSGHWVAGHGQGVDPGWNAQIPSSRPTDIVNQYLLVLAQFGLVGLLPFLGMNIIVIKKLIDGYRASILHSDKWLVWCLSAGFLGLAGAFMSVSIFGQPVTVYAMMIGFVGALPAIITRPRIRLAPRRKLSFSASVVKGSGTAEMESLNAES